ncbi:MAG: hypothetical protein V3R95_02840 [Dehalococcoidia bacterium]
MAGEFVHADVGGELTEAEYHSLLAHLLNDQARGDLVISNAAASGLVRLPRGTPGQHLLMGADDPQWGDAGGTPLHAIPAAIGVSAGDYVLFVSMHEGTTGQPDRCVIVTVLSTSAVAIVEYKRLGDAWLFDPADCAYDLNIALNFTNVLQSHITAFAIDSPVSSGDRVVFIAGNNDAGTDTFEIDSIVLAPGGSSLTATAVVIAGSNQPTDTNNMATCGIPISATRVMTFFQDDAHFADITYSDPTYTFTYTDAKVLAVDTSISANQQDARSYSGKTIGSQVVLLHAKDRLGGSNVMWEMTTSAVLTEEFNPFVTGLQGGDQGIEARGATGMHAIDGAFAVAAPVGGDSADGQMAAFIASSFPLDSI